MLTVAGQGQGESQVPPCSRGALAALRAVLWRKDLPASAQRLAGLQPPDGIEAHCFALVVFTFLISSHSGWISMWNLTKSFMSGLAMQLSGRAWARPWVPSSAPSIKKKKMAHFKGEFFTFKAYAGAGERALWLTALLPLCSQNPRVPHNHL